MNIKVLARSLAYGALVSALLAAAVTVDNRQHSALRISNAGLPPGADIIDAQLAYCRSIGIQAADDPVCKAVWDANRVGFLGSRKLYHDRVTGTVPAATELSKPTSLPGQELSRSAPRPAATPNAGTPDTPGNTAERPR